MIKIIDWISKIMAVLLGIGVPSLYIAVEKIFNTRPDQFMRILILLWITTHLGLFLAPDVREKGIICRVIVAILMLPSIMLLLGVFSIGCIIIGGIMGIYGASWSIKETVGFICGFVLLSMGLIIYLTQYNLLFRGILFKPIYLRRLIVRERGDICTRIENRSVDVPMAVVENGMKDRVPIIKTIGLYFELVFIGIFMLFFLFFLKEIIGELIKYIVMLIISFEKKLGYK